MSSIVELARVITPENQAEVLPRFFHASKQEAKAVAAEIAPREVLPERVVVTALPTPKTVAAAPAPCAPAPLELGHPLHPGETRIAASLPAVQPPAPPSTVDPLTADLRRLHVTVSKRFMEKLELARNALSHSHPGADVETLLEEGLDLLLDRAAKRRGLVKKARAAPPPSAHARNPRSVPAAVSREVFLRDEGKCQWETADGGGQLPPIERRLLAGFRCGSGLRRPWLDPLKCWMLDANPCNRLRASPLIGMGGPSF